VETQRRRCRICPCGHVGVGHYNVRRIDSIEATHCANKVGDATVAYPMGMRKHDIQVKLQGFAHVGAS
jgi:hypothetical protein